LHDDAANTSSVGCFHERGQTFVEGRFSSDKRDDFIASNIIEPYFGLTGAQDGQVPLRAKNTRIVAGQTELDGPHHESFRRS